ncbi:MAG: hypothetical protein ACOCVI_00675 [Planctomycetota bacterium]
MKRAVHIALLTAALLAVVAPAAGGSIGYEEDFALAEDRAKALKELIPGTRDYFYYHCLHYQHIGRYDQVDGLLKDWIAKFKRTDRVKEIQRRQWLLRYNNQPKESVRAIVDDLNLRFPHEKETLRSRTTLPTKLDPRSISRETLTQRALRSHSNSLGGFETSAFDWLVTMPEKLNASRRRDLLRRIDRPDYPGLVKLIVADLDYPRTGGFGSLAIHRKLTRKQLDALLKEKPSLLNHTQFVTAYLQRLAPNPDVDWQQNDKIRLAWYSRLWDFTKKLGPVHNSLKANVLYNWLEWNLQRGVWDKDLFLSYIAIPRPGVYIDRDWLKTDRARRYKADLSKNYHSVARILPPIRKDLQLIQRYFEHWFIEEDSIKPYVNYVENDYLQRWLAETKLIHNIGPARKYAEMLTPAQYRALKDRVDLEFVETNPKYIAPAQPVALKARVKNVKKLIAKVYEVNTVNFYRRKGKEVGTDINLNGLVPNAEVALNFDLPSLRQHTVELSAKNKDVAKLFDAMKSRGVYVLELIGNGQSSRAVIRKGRMRVATRVTPGGLELTPLNAAGKLISGAKVLLGEREFSADKDGRITVPYSTDPGRSAIVIVHDGFASLDHVHLPGENYRLHAGFHVDREQLIEGKTAKLLVRPMLTLNGEPIGISPLSEPKLTITATDIDGVSTQLETRDPNLAVDSELVREFTVPARLAKLTFEIRGKVTLRTTDSEKTLRAADDMNINAIDRTYHTRDIHLLRTDKGYFLQLRGKTGEERPREPVRVQLKHQDFQDPVHASLHSDDKGRITLGALPGIDWIQASIEGVSHKWMTYQPDATYPDVIHARAGETIELPWLGEADKPQRTDLALIEIRNGANVADRFDALAIRGGMLTVNDLPRGDYTLTIKPRNVTIDIHVIQGESVGRLVINNERWLELDRAKPLNITKVSADDENLVVQVANADRWTRVHVVAVRYWPAYGMFADLAGVPASSPSRRSLHTPPSQYVSERKISDEYRYILTRRYAEKYPGVMLQRPGLLLNPWVLQETQADVQTTEAEEAYGPADRAPSAEQARLRDQGRGAALVNDFANFDFLSAESVVLENLKVDRNGRVAIPRNLMGTKQLVMVLAVSPERTVYRQIALGEKDPTFRDLRLIHNLDPNKHFTRQNRVTPLTKGQSWTLAHAASAEVKFIDSLDEAFQLYQTLSGNPTLAKFSWILRWKQLSDTRKREKYSEFACHELHFFLYHKDRPFFDKVIKPYLANKKDKTFMDHWLLGDDLSDYVKPWEYHRLNVAERVLLSRRIRGERKHTAAHIRDLYELLDRDPKRLDTLFDAALAVGGMDRKGKLDGLFGAVDMREHKGPELMPDEISSGISEQTERSGGGRDNTRRRKMIEDYRKKLAGEDTDSFQDDDGRYFEGEQTGEKQTARFYRKLGKTREWAENNYYHLPIEAQTAKLIEVNGFWDDYAHHDDDGPFLSTHLPEANSSFAEMMLALAVLDLPFEAGEHTVKEADNRKTVTTASPAVVFHREIRPAKLADDAPPILVSQNFYRYGDRYRHEDGQRYDKYVTEFLPGVVYGCHVVITNPTSAPRRLEVLLQIPRGAMPVGGEKATRATHVNIEPYRTHTLDYCFYFPTTGQYEHFPVHVAMDESPIAAAKPVTLKVVKELSREDTTSWAYISQFGSEKQVLDYLGSANLHRIDLSKIAWRCNRTTSDSPRPADFLEKVVTILKRRHVYSHVLWSYGLKHHKPDLIREYLKHDQNFAGSVGPKLDSPLLTVDPVERRWYQHLEYRPLVNPRKHRLHEKWEITNDRFFNQYQRFLTVLAYVPQLDDEYNMSVTYYLLLQDRITEAKTFFARVDPENLPTRLQYDYFTAYMDFLSDSPEKLTAARAMAKKYADYPVDRWRKLFAAVQSQLDELDGKETALVDEKDRTQVQTKLAADAPQLEIKKIADGTVALATANLERVRVNFYRMDVELLFSRQPFAGEFAGQFSLIKPNATMTVDLDADQPMSTFELPKAFRAANVLVEVTGGGVTRSKAYYANSLAVRMIENYGQLQVLHDATRKPLAKVYVKVYARMTNGQVKFYKDGYTDLRGRFDYTSLNLDLLSHVKEFSVLVLSEKHGAVVKEANPPKR